MATYINTDSQSWSKLQQFGTPQAQQLVAKGLQDINKQLLSDSNIVYETDIKSWIDGVMIAVLPRNSTIPIPSNPPIPVQSEPNILLVVGIKDKLNALKFATKLKEQKNLQIQESEYKGEKIIASTSRSKSTYYIVF
ncbi:DUF3352 domain-containing protein [Trichormus azollae HNT15244]